METESLPQGLIEEDSPPLSVKCKVLSQKQNGDTDSSCYNGDSIKNGVEEQRVPELRRSTRSTPSKKKDDPDQVKDKLDETEELQIGEKSEVPEKDEVLKIYKKSFIRNENKKDQGTMTPSPSSGKTFSGRVSGRRSFRQSLNRKRRAECDEDNDTTPTKKQNLNESWIKSPGWRYLATPFSKLFASTPRPTPESDSMIVQFDEKTINCREEISEVANEAAGKTTPRWGCSIM